MIKTDSLDADIPPFDTYFGWASVLHMLTANKANHDPLIFTEILHHIVLAIDKNNSNSHLTSLVIKKTNRDTTPLGLLWHSLKHAGLSDTDILRDNDFIFLLKATCYHWKHLRLSLPDYEERSREIDTLPFDYAFLICCSTFEKEFSTKVLEDLFRVNNNLLLEKDRNEVYPIHGIIRIVGVHT